MGAKKEDKICNPVRNDKKEDKICNPVRNDKKAGNFINIITARQLV